MALKRKAHEEVSCEGNIENSQPKKRNGRGQLRDFQVPDQRMLTGPDQLRGGRTVFASKIFVS